MLEVGLGAFGFGVGFGITADGDSEIRVFAPNNLDEIIAILQVAVGGLKLVLAFGRAAVHGAQVFLASLCGPRTTDT